LQPVVAIVQQMHSFYDSTYAGLGLGLREHRQGAFSKALNQV